MRRALYAVSLSLLVVFGATAAPRRAASHTIFVSAIAAPQPVIVNGVPHLAWELLLRNYRAEDITVTSVDAGLASQSNILLRPGAGASVVYFLVSTNDVPPFINHVIELTSSRGRETIYGPLTEVRTDPPIVLSAPLRGERWFAANGLHDQSHHRRAAIVIDGRVRIPQRYAIDWVQISQQGSTFSGDVRRNESFFAYGEELLAVADGVVTVTQDGIPENVPRQAPVVPITLESAPGNFVILDAGDGHYVLYAHLQPGSLRVKAGDRVAKGDVIGLVGNSGNSTEPHLHFHVCDANAALACDGLPYVFDQFTTNGAVKRLELPANGAIIDFN